MTAPLASILNSVQKSNFCTNILIKLRPFYNCRHLFNLCIILKVWCTTLHPICIPPPTAPFFCGENPFPDGGSACDPPPPISKSWIHGSQFVAVIPCLACWTWFHLLDAWFSSCIHWKEQPVCQLMTATSSRWSPGWPIQIRSKGCCSCSLTLPQGPLGIFTLTQWDFTVSCTPRQKQPRNE